MTCYLSGSQLDRYAARVTRLGRNGTHLAREALERRPRTALVQVTHTSVGITDAIAARGDYLLQPVRGFTPGYDFVGVIKHLPNDNLIGLQSGQRVAGILPRMGAHASLINVSPSLLVPVPASLDSALAATVPLDALTAHAAIDLLAPTSETILVQGAGGSVGAWAAQIASTRGITVYGTASPRSRAYAELFSNMVFDYNDSEWVDQLLDLTDGGVDGAIDHTGNKIVARAIRSAGRLIHTAFGGKPGEGRTRTATGSFSSILHRFGKPRERICSAPLLVALQRERYRRALSELLHAVSNETLIPPRPDVASFENYTDALEAASHPSSGSKIVLVMPQP